MELFSSSNINFDALRRKAFNFRWAEVEDGVIPLTAADPDFPVAPEIIGAITDYLSDGYLSYTPKLGLPQLRKAIAEDLCSRKNEGVSEDLVLPVDSAARGM
ncbi:MAG: pyridoxal phosphate-dependent aminotransferase, partial [Firmicutes bacterium]|nr:pyridoxal phosphate-dependent aminotransferase [Bacillota bacterium]